MKKKGVKKKEVREEEIKGKSISLFDLLLIPSSILIVYTILISTLQNVISSFPQQFQTVISILGLLLQVSIFSYIGFKLAENKIKKASLSFFAGFVSGAVVAFVGAIIGLISLYFFPSIYEHAIELMLQQGITSEVAWTSMQIASGINLIVGPLINGLIGGIISWISYLIFKKRN